MLPSWRDQLRIALSPDQVTLLRIRRGVRPLCSAKLVIPCAAGQGWEGALAGLAEALKKPEWQNARATVILSNHFVRYQMTPWSDQLNTDAERAALMRHGFAEVYGPAAAGWELRWSGDQPGSPWLASAVEKPLLDRLRETLAPAGLSLYSLQPYLMAAFNGWRKEFTGARQWFVLGEPGRICISRFQGGGWRGIRSHRIEGAWKDEAPLILERELLLAEGDGAPQEILLLAPEGLNSAGGAAWQIRQLQPVRLPGLPAGEERQYAMALGGLS